MEFNKLASVIVGLEMNIVFMFSMILCKSLQTSHIGEQENIDHLTERSNAFAHVWNSVNYKRRITRKLIKTINICLVPNTIH